MKFGQKSSQKLVKRASSSMRIYTGTPTLACSRKKNVFNKFYKGDHGKIQSNYRLLSKRTEFFSTGDQSYGKNYYFFSSLHV